MVSLTEALGFLPAPIAVALACQHAGQGQLITLVAGVADAGAPDKVCTNNLSIGDGGRLTTDDRYKESKRNRYISFCI